MSNMTDQSSRDISGLPQRSEDLDDLLARLEVQEQLIQEQKLEIASKKKETSDFQNAERSGSHTRDNDQQVSFPMPSSAGHRGFQGPTALETRLANLGTIPDNPVHRNSLFEQTEDIFIQDQINKHTFTQALDPDFYAGDVDAPGSPIDQGNITNAFRPIIPRASSYATGSIWSDSKPRGLATTGMPPQLPSLGYWPPFPGRSPTEQEPISDWKVVGSDLKNRGHNGPGLANTVQGGPNRQIFSPSPLSPPFVPGNASPAWNTGAHQPTSPGHIGNGPTPNFANLPYGNYQLPPAHAEPRGPAPNWNKPAHPPSQAAPMGPNLYGNPGEPPNWKRLIERGVACDWGFLVDRVVLHNDQGASVFLQHKLKDFDHPEHKVEIMDAIVDKSLPLMMNRFGNFLVQRCFEHGEQYHVESIMKLIKGRVVQLSMDAFGCHVIQRALDTVAEPFKVMIIQELLHHIPETVMHRYACHVWQKLFEVRWVSNPPQIMKFMNDALAGMWTEIAMGETGSLVVQNIFENCLDDDKRPCVNEVLANLDIIARGQFGNWCIQHICEHGAPRDQSIALDMVLHNAVEYSMDQYASKVVEKCLKANVAPGFLDRYLERVCEGRSDRPRLPIIDIASDQYGNYLIQLILGTAPMHLRELVANHIRKHMVSIRGSKFGSRVGMLCVNNNYVNYNGQQNQNRGGHGNNNHHMHGGAGHRNNWKGYR